MRSVFFTLSFSLILAAFTVSASRSALAAGEEVEIGFKRALGFALAAQSAPSLLHCPEAHRADPVPERAPAHRAAHPIVLRIEPRPCDPGHGWDGSSR